MEAQARLLIYPLLDDANPRCTEIPITQFFWGDRELTHKEAMDCLEQNADDLKTEPIRVTFQDAHPRRCELRLGQCGYPTREHNWNILRCVCECPPNGIPQARLQTSLDNPDLNEFAKMVRGHASPYRAFLEAHLKPSSAY